MFKKFLFILALASSFQVHSCDLFKDETPILQGGRVKPYFVFSKETLKYLTGKSSWNNLNANQTICLVYKDKIDLKVKIQHDKLRSFLSSENQVGLKSLLLRKDEIRAEYMAQEFNDSYKKSLNAILNKILIYESIAQGNAFSIFIKHQDKIQWSPVSFFKSRATLKEKAEKSVSLYKTNFDDTFLLELKFSKSHIFSYAMLLAIIGIFIIVLTKKYYLYHSVVILTLLLQIIGITLRVIISGRAPITNMYETVLFSGFGALLISYIIFNIKKEKLYLIGGLSYNILCLFMMMFANNMLSSAISPLVPVLRDNFWLSTHVTCVILSYAALALSWIIANITLFKLKFTTVTTQELNHHFELIYNCIKVGVVLLSAGVILGGIWADYSWGRFWGWDPKETWSLIVLLFYLAILHGKYSNWINNRRFVILAAAGFMTVMMAWFGVNYILASGLHSYGFSEGGAIFLGSFFLIQILIILFTSIRFSRK